MTIRVRNVQHTVWKSRRVAGWVVIGVTASLIELALLRVLYEILAWPLPVATAVAAEVLILTKFFVADHWVFGHVWPTLGRLGRYQGASFGAFAVSWLVINGLAAQAALDQANSPIDAQIQAARALVAPGFLGLPYQAAFVVGTGAAFAWSLVTNFLWVWAQPARHNH